ncbi:MAG: MFS transporter [Actinomycetota bacterium]|nr:MFS transporter [Actinomycetota bacterium]
MSEDLKPAEPSTDTLVATPQAAGSSAAEPPAGSGRDGIWSNPDFVRLWSGETVSLIGTQITQFTLPLVAILTLGASVFEVGLLNACRYSPVVVVSLFAGVWLDRRKRRPVLIACSLGNAVLIAIVPIADGFGVLSIGLLYVVCLLVGVLTVIFDVGVLSYVPSLVERRHLADSNGQIQTSTSLAGIAGPGLAGLLVGILTAPVTLTVDAVSYLCSAIGLITISQREEEPEQPEVRPSVRASIAEGLRAVYGSRLLRSLLSQSATFNFFQNAFITVFVVYALRDLHLSTLKLGIVIGAISVGGVAGATVANRVRKFAGFGRTVLMTTIFAAGCPLVVLIPRGNGFLALTVLIVAEVVYGFNVLVFNVNTITLRQTITPNRLLGRMNASYRLVLFGTGPIGAVLGGWLGSVVGLRNALVVCAFALVTPALWIFFSPIFRMRDMPEGSVEEQLIAAAQTPAAVSSAAGTPATTGINSSGTGNNET